MLRFSFHALADSKARSDGFPEASYHHFLNSESANEWELPRTIAFRNFKLNHFNNLGLIWYPIPALGSPVYDFQPQVWQSDMTCFGRALAEEAAAAAAAKTLARMPKESWISTRLPEDAEKNSLHQNSIYHSDLPESGWAFLPCQEIWGSFQGDPKTTQKLIWSSRLLPLAHTVPKWAFLQ